MTFSQYCKDKWISILIFSTVFLAGSFILLFIGIPVPVVGVIDCLYALGFLSVLAQDHFTRKDFYGKLEEISEDLEEISYLSDFLTEPPFLEGQLLFQILRRDEKFMNDQIADYQRELQEYKTYVETWAHEVKTPIAVSRLIMENHRDEVTRSLAEEMDKLEGFVEQMLFYTKSSSLHDDYIIREVSLKALVMKAVKKNAKLMIGAKVSPRFEGLEETVLADAKWLDFILGQLISNAVKYHSEQRKPEIIFSACRSKKTVAFSITDNGIGIPSEDTDRVFRRGFTGVNGRNYPKSTGMGLYLCDTLCRKQGIRISLTSKEGEGTSVTLYLTAASAEESSNITKM